jgi:pimeloyl-ACP methyl ester carboxylesterase
MPNIVYLHGFASSPLSTKGRFFNQQFAVIGADVSQPQLDAGDFSSLTITKQLAVVSDAVDELKPVLLMGSSMGGYLAALYAVAEPEKCPALMLMAPAFDFANRWSDRLGPEDMEEWKQTGSFELHHYGNDRRESVGYELYEDALKHDAFPAVTQRTLVFHGRYDEDVDPQLSVEFSWGKPNVQLELVDSDHQLLNVTDLMWERTASFYHGL